MRILYAIQGTGNGHLSRAHELIPILKKKAEVDILLSGREKPYTFPYKIQYEMKGLTMKYNNKGHLSICKSVRSSKFIKLLSDIRRDFIRKYDLVISDFEPVSAWAAKKVGIPTLALSHQSAFLSKNTPRPAQKNPFAELIIRKLAPCDFNIGFHFKKYDDFIYTPVIRKEVRNAELGNEDYILVYLPSYNKEKCLTLLRKFGHVHWKCYVNNVPVPVKHDNVYFYPIGSKGWFNHFRKCKGIIMNAGFEGPSEALYLGKNLIVLPIQKQYEQVCNAVALRQFGIPVLNTMNKLGELHLEYLLNRNGKRILFEDHTEELTDRIASIIN